MEEKKSRKVGTEQIRKANEILRKYRAGKASLERRVIASEQWWKLRHWDYMDDMGNPRDGKSASAWLFNCIISKHADGVEACPEPNILPRESGDQEEARRLSCVVPMILEQNDFEEVYSSELWQKLKQGTGVYGVFWDRERMGGLGDVAIRQMDILNLFWEPGIKDIQKSANVFSTELVDISLLREQYPDILTDEALTGHSFEPARYLYDDHVDTSDKAVVVDWYYHLRGKDGRQVLHYAKYVDEFLLYATQNDPVLAEKGLYDHGLYPFVFDPLFPVEGSPAGYGYIDIGRSPQAMIDHLNQALEKNALMAANPRWFIRGDGSVNEEEFADWTKPFVHVPNGQLGDDSLKQIEVRALPGQYIQILLNKIEELKETTGNRDTANGGTQSGVTAASAIAAMQEQAGKTSRASTIGGYRAYRRLVLMVIELIRQFYELPRQFRVLGAGGAARFIRYDNAHLRPQPQGLEMGIDLGSRMPLFDVTVSAQRMNSYTKVAQNELALQLYQLGILDPSNADRALALLRIMDFSHKDVIEDKVQENAGMFQLLTRYQQIALELAREAGRTDVLESLAQNAAGVQRSLNPGAMAKPRLAGQNSDAVQGIMPEEHPFVRKAREQAAASGLPGGGAA